MANMNEYVRENTYGLLFNFLKVNDCFGEII